eukprot:gene8840-biopygen3951
MQQCRSDKPHSGSHSDKRTSGRQYMQSSPATATAAGCIAFAASTPNPSGVLVGAEWTNANHSSPNVCRLRYVDGSLQSVLCPPGSGGWSLCCNRTKNPGTGQIVGTDGEADVECHCSSCTLSSAAPTTSPYTSGAPTGAPLQVITASPEASGAPTGAPVQVITASPETSGAPTGAPLQVITVSPYTSGAPIAAPQN